MGRSIRDYERNGKIHEIKKRTYEFEIYEPVDKLQWISVWDHLPEVGQRVLICGHNDFRCWVEDAYYADGMFFDTGWEWADEVTKYDAWMCIPLPIGQKG